jgi:tetratricopeptide (TPR) repeat protein
MPEPDDLDAALARLTERLDPHERSALALELTGRAAALRNAGQHEQAIRLADLLLERLGPDPPPEAPHIAVDALLAKAANLFDLGRVHEGLAVYDRLIADWGRDAAQGVRTRIAEALAYKGHLLFRQPDGGEQAIAVFDELVIRYGDAPEPALREKVASGLQWKALALIRIGRAEQAAAACDELLARFADAREPALAPQVGFALEQRATTLMRLGRNQEASAVCDGLLARFGEESSPELRELTGRTLRMKDYLLVLEADMLIGKAADLFAAERWEAALEVFEAIVDRFADAGDPALRRRVVLAMSNSVVALMALLRFDEATATHEELAARFGEDAIATFDEVATRLADAAAPELRRHAAGALANKAGVLRGLDRRDEARSAFTELIDRFADDQDETIQELVAQANDHRAALLDAPDRQGEAG